MGLSLNKLLDFVLLMAISLFIGWYFYDAYSELASVENLIFIAPVATLTLGLCTAEFIRNLREKNAKTKHMESIRDALPVMVMFTGYILSLEYIGFDVGTVLFIAIFLRLHGELRWHWIILYSVLFGLIMSYFFSQMLPYPMPMSLFPTDY